MAVVGVTGVAHQPDARATETFKPIPGHLGYEVSDHGTVRSLDRVVPRVNPRWGTASNMKRKGQTLKSTLLQIGYFAIGLENDKKFYIHELVLLAFVGPRPKGAHVNHKDGNKLNNHISNLEYCTRSWNSAHAHHCRLYVGAPNAALTAEQVIAINERLKAGTEGAPSIARDFGVSKTTIYDIAHGRSWGWLTGNGS